MYPRRPPCLSTNSRIVQSRPTSLSACATIQYFWSHSSSFTAPQPPCFDTKEHTTIFLRRSGEFWFLHAVITHHPPGAPVSRHRRRFIIAFAVAHATSAGLVSVATAWLETRSMPPHNRRLSYASFPPIALSSFPAHVWELPSTSICSQME